MPRLARRGRTRARISTARYVKTVCLSHLCTKTKNIYQDRLGTNIGKAQKQAIVFLQAAAAKGQLHPLRGDEHEMLCCDLLLGSVVEMVSEKREEKS